MMPALAGLALQAATPASVAALPPAASEGHGASVPFQTLEAEDGVTDGTILGPDRRFGTLAAEASGRRAVRLTGSEQLRFTLPAPADAMTLRYAMPDAPDGGGLQGRMAVYAEGRRIATVPLTSRFAWYYGSYPFTNQPKDGRAHHFYDHVRLRLGRTLPAGTQVTVAREASDRTGWTVIDLADFERAPAPRAPPADALSVRAFGADPSGRRDARAAFQRAIDRGRATGRPVWIPPGRYRIDGHLRVDRVTLLGAGHWHSVLRGNGIGIFGHDGARGSRDVWLAGFAMLGEVAERVDRAQLQAIGGALSDSIVEDLWIQHTKVGLWISGPAERLTVRRLRVYDQAADGVNFHGGVTRSAVEDSFFRNLGDDGLAMWSHRHENRGNAFRRNTIVAPVLANGIAIYGGRDIRVEGNLVADTVTQGGGLHLGQRFDATRFAGVIRLHDNLVVRGGSMDPNWNYGIGALWIDARDGPITGARILIEGDRYVDSSFAAVQFHGLEIRGVAIEAMRIMGAGSGAFQLQAPGAATVGHTHAEGLGAAAVLDAGRGFDLHATEGNRGWSDRAPLP